MTSHVRHRRSLTAGAPLPGLPMEPGELALNLPDMQLFTSSAGTPYAMLAVRPFVTTGKYLANDIVVVAGQIYSAKLAVGPKAFDAADWNLISYSGGALANPVNLIDGTAAAPALAFSSDPATGVYRAAMGVLGLAAGGVLAASASATGLTLPDGKSIKWGDGSNSLTGSGVTDVLALAGSLDASMGIRAQGVIAGNPAISASYLGAFSGAPFVGLTASGGAVDGKLWDFLVQADGTRLHGRLINDASSGTVDWLSATRAGMALVSTTLYAPSVGIGAVPNVAYSLDVQGSLPPAIHWKNSSNGMEGALGTGAGYAYVNSIGGDLAFQRGGTEIVRALANGLQMQVSTSWILHNGTTGLIGILAGAGAADGTARLELYDTANAANAKNAILYGQTVQFRSPIAATEYGRFDASGNFLVGETAPAFSFAGRGNIEINGSGSSILGLCIGAVAKGYLIASGGTVQLQTTAGSTLSLGTVGAASITIDGAQVASYLGNEVGWKNLPMNVQTGAYVAVSADRAKAIVQQSAATSVQFNAGIFNSNEIITVYNNSGATTQILQGAGATLRYGTSGQGTRNLANNGIATIWWINGSIAVITGTGLT